LLKDLDHSDTQLSAEERQSKMQKQNMEISTLFPFNNSEIFLKRGWEMGV
jgi:hypothetical protein